MKIKRKPTLADMLIGTSLNWANGYDKTAKANLLTAKRFVIDREATQYIGNMVHDIPRIIADAQDFAIPPFENMWVEMPFDAYYEAVNRVPNIDWKHRGEPDKMWGMLIRGSSVRVAAGGNDNKALFTPCEYLLHRPWTPQEEMAFRDKYSFSGMTLNAFLWGSSFEDMSANAQDSKNALREAHSVRAVQPDKHKGDDLFVADTMLMGAGDLRNIIAVLLFLNRTQGLQIIHEEPAARGFVGNHLRPYLKHSVITIKVDPVPHLKLMTAGHGAFKRLHDVRGHFCHNRRARESGCMHPDWEETDEGRQWKCLACGGLKWWRHEHKRGHEELGYVSSEYQVRK